MGDLRWVAWGLIVVAVDLRFNGVDFATDAVGWAMVCGGLLSLAALHRGFQLAGVAAVLGLLSWAADPWLGVDREAAYLAEILAQTGVVFATCTALMSVVPQERASADRIRWWDLVLGLLIVVLAPLLDGDPGAGVVLLPLVVAAVVVYIGFLVLLFRCARLGPAAASPT